MARISAAWVWRSSAPCALALLCAAPGAAAQRVADSTIQNGSTFQQPVETPSGAPVPGQVPEEVDVRQDTVPKDTLPKSQEPELVGPPALEGQPETPSVEGEPLQPVRVPARAPLPAYSPAYRSFADAALYLGALAHAAPDVATMFELGLASDGRPVPALELAHRGDSPASARPTVFLFGALDGVSQSGTEAVLAVVHHLLEVPERIPAGLSIVAVPWAAPEGLDVLAAGGVSDGANTRALDDDRDGALDEDPPDDMNDDGVILQMLVADPRGKWTRCSDGRFLALAGPFDQPRYSLVPEGRDDDGDGRFNEDGLGGVVLERNFPLGRRGPWVDPRCGVVPLSEPLARALADLVLSRRAAAVLVFQGNHGGLAMPGGVPELDRLFELDRPVYARLAQQFALATGREPDDARSLRDASGAERPGCALDWFAGVAGALSLELAAWGPRVDIESRGGGDGNGGVRDARYNGAAHQGKPADTRPAPADELSAWAAWLDNRRGGIGFDDWKRSDPEGGVTALVGGWRPRTLLDPPEATLPRALEGLPRFVDELLASAPVLELSLSESARDGEICRLRVRLENRGRLPSGPARVARANGVPGVELELICPEGSSVLAGEARVELERLVGGAVSREVGWIVLAPPGSKFELRARAPWCADVVVEVAP